MNTNEVIKKILIPQSLPIIKSTEDFHKKMLHRLHDEINKGIFHGVSQDGKTEVWVTGGLHLVRATRNGRKIFLPTINSVDINDAIASAKRNIAAAQELMSSWLTAQLTYELAFLLSN